MYDDEARMKVLVQRPVDKVHPALPVQVHVLVIIIFLPRILMKINKQRNTVIFMVTLFLTRVYFLVS